MFTKYPKSKNTLHFCKVSMCIHCVSCKSADRLCDDEVDFTRQCIRHHSIESVSLFGVGCTYSFVRMPAPLVPEPPDMDVESMLNTLRDRLDENLVEMMDDLRAEITNPTLTNGQVSACAENITAVSNAYSNLIEASLSGEQAEYLLTFQNPLAVVADHWPVTLDGLLNMRDVVDDILEDRDLHDDYPKVSDVAAPAAKEAGRSGAGAEKPSVLEQIRQAREDAQHAPVPRKEHASKEHEPER